VRRGERGGREGVKRGAVRQVMGVLGGEVAILWEIRGAMIAERAGGGGG